MGRIVTLAEAQSLQGQEKHWAYNALDCTGTREIADVLLPRLDAGTARTYAFERALQAPFLAMMRRGVNVDTSARSTVLAHLTREFNRDTKAIQKLPGVAGVWNAMEMETGMCPEAFGKHHKWPRGVPDGPERKCERCGVSRMKPSPFNAGSNPQCMHLLYDLHKVKQLRNKDGDVAMDDDILERIGKQSAVLHTITEAIRDLRDKKKQIGFLGAKLTPDARFPSSFNVGAAWTGRASSSKNPYGLGGNLQNVAEQHRHIFIADPGYEMFYADLKQAESLAVAFLSGDPKYKEAHFSGDTHTFVTRLVWPNMAWTGDMKRDKVLAKSLPEWDPVPGHDFRFQAKRIQHGSNYGLTPFGIAIIAHIPVSVAKEAQDRYFHNFPYIRQWQKGIAKSVEGSEALINAVGRRIRLFGRPWDGHTYKQGLSFKPQSLVADVLDLAIFRAWDGYDPVLLQLLAQVHDAILGQYPTENREAAIAALVECLTIPVQFGDEYMTIPVEIAVGANWGHKSDKNPYGLQEIEL